MDCFPLGNFTGRCQRLYEVLNWQAARAVCALKLPSRWVRRDDKLNIRIISITGKVIQEIY